ncbi:MAG TPA: MBL fold metallo-hydrolase [Candidatus Gracilibacteria bacterium]
MKIEFAGAAQNVTGSKHLLHINGQKILLDCGMFQGHHDQAEEANQYFPFPAPEINALVLSHAHIDHCGLIPLLVKKGFTGPVYCTHATRDLCGIMLRDSAHIQEKDAEWLKKKGKDKNAVPLYTVADAEKCLANFRSINYEQRTRVGRGVFVTFHDAGHILGSAMETWEIHDEETHQDIRLGFTGDLGRRNLPILKDPSQLEHLDVLLTESTYGNRLHDEISDVEEQLTQVIKEAAERKGKIYVPAFSMGRTQEILYILNQLMHANKIPTMPIFVDSPLANSATEIFSIHPECFDDEINKLLDAGENPFNGDGVQFTQSVEESKALNEFPGPAIVISASGMCEFGRIKHHLANNLSNPKNLVLIVGFMAQNTLGRKLVEGENPVNIFGEAVPVRAQIKIFNAFSGHADQKGLLRFASRCGEPKNVFLVHGELEAQEVFRTELGKLENLRSAETFIPAPGEIYELQADKSWKLSHEKNMVCEGLVCKI